MLDKTLILDINYTTDSLYNESIKYFRDKNYIQRLLEQGKGRESIIGRYIISKKIKTFLEGYNNMKEPYYPLIGIDGKPQFDKYYWSLSHKHGIIFNGIGDIRHGLDIEKYKVRDISLLSKFSKNEYNLLNSISNIFHPLFGNKEWFNFFLLWTGKESIIKYELGELIDMDSIKLVDIKYKSNKITEIDFKYIIKYSYKGKIYNVLSGFNYIFGHMYIYSICI